MRSRIIRPREDFGRHVRTQFELSEAGENNLVLDELQYQLDILFGKGASLDTKVSSLNSIVKIFTSELPIGAQKLLRSGANDLLLQVSSCLEEDKLSASAVALILAISSDNDGSFDPSLPIPVEMLSKLVDCVVTDEPMKHCVCRDSSAGSFGDHQHSDLSADNTGFRKKRKFGSGANPSASLMLAPSGDAPSVTRQYGSVKSVSSNLDSQSFGSQSSQAVSATGDAQSDDYWAEEPQNVSAPTAVMLSVGPIVAPVAPVATGPGGFHRKRKMGSGAALASVPASATSLPVVTLKAHSSGSSSSQPSKHPTASQSVATSALRERFNTLFCTFLCDKADSSQHTRTCASTLHMVLLNRYLSARVAALASVKTDMFLSSDNTDAQDPHPEEDTKASTQRTELTTQQSQQQDGGLGGGAKYQAQAEALSALQSCLRSNEGNRGSYLGKLCDEVHILCTNRFTKKEHVHLLNNSTTGRGISKKHTACAERTSLGALWLALGILDSACFRCPQNQSYLAGHELWQTEEQDTSLVHTLASFLQHLTPQLLRQVQDSHRAELTQRAAKQQAQAQQGAIEAVSVVPSPGQVGRFGTPIVGSGANSRGTGAHGSTGACSTGRGSAAGHSSTQPTLPAEWEKFRNLFPEIPVVISHKPVASVVVKRVADSISSQDALWQDEDVLCLSSPQKTPIIKAAPPPTSVSTTETEKEVRAVVGLQEVCTAALKTLVSLSNDCEEIAHALVHSSHTSQPSLPSPHSSRLSSPLGTQNSQHTGQTPPAQARDVVSWAVAMLAWCAAWRCSLAASEGAHSSETRHKKDRLPQRRGVSGALSPDETALERFVFDLMLYLQSFLTNLAEFAPDSIADVTVWPCLCSYDIFQYLPEKSAETTSHAAYLSEKCPLLSHILECKSPRAFGSPASTPAGMAGKTGVRAQVKSMRLPELLVEVLHLEAMDFLVDLEETDEAINRQMGQGPMSPQPQSSTQQSPLKLKDASSPSGKASTSTHSRAKAAKASSDEGNMPVPVAELIVSAHAALLLHTLTLTAAAPVAEEENHRKCIQDVASPARATPSQSQLTPVGFQQVVDKQRAQRRKGLAMRVRAQLPRGNWWLCVRVLKAFLTLQGQTGIMLLENLSPVLAAVQSMSRQDYPEHLLCTTSTTTMSVKLIEGQYDSPETQQKLIQAPTSASLSKNNSNKRAIDLTADMPGKIDFLDLWAEDAPPAKKEATSGDKSAGEWVWNGNDYVWQAPSTPAMKTALMSPLPAAPIAVVAPAVSTSAVAQKAASASMTRTTSSTSVDSLYKSSFKPRAFVSSAPVSASVSAATAGVKSLSRASSTTSSQGTRETKGTAAPPARKKVGVNVAPKEAAALPRTSLSSARHFSASDDDEEEEESSHLWSTAAAARLERVPVRASPQKVPQTKPKPKIEPNHINPDIELSLEHAKPRTEGDNSVTAAAMEMPKVKESGGWRSKRKTFGAPVKAVEAPSQNWFE